MGAYTYSTTASSNTSVDSIGSQGSSDAANIDNLIRALAASDAALVRDLGGANTSVSGTDTILVGLADPSAVTSYFDGMRFSFRAAGTTTVTNPTLNVDSIGAKTIKKTIQGTESALVIGDIRAGQTVEVVYRSAWASAAGAFELLTTGNGIIEPAGSTAGDILYRASTGYTRLAVGSNGQLLKLASGIPSWGNAFVFGAGSSLSGTSVTLSSSIPSWVTHIQLVLADVSLNGTDQIVITLGDSGGFEFSGFVGSGQAVVTTGTSTTSSTSAFVIRSGAAGDSMSGVVNIIRPDAANGATWVASGVGTATANGGWIMGGSKTLTGTLDRIAIGSAAGVNTFDTGYVGVYWA